MKSVRGPQYSLTVRVEVRHEPGMLAKVAGAIGDAAGEATRSGIAQAPLEQKGFRPADDAAA